MEASSPTRPAVDLATQLYYQLVYTLTDLLPPPLDDSPEALRARNHAAIAKVAPLLPVNANELDLAAQCIAARAQAEDVLRLLRENAHDLPLVMRLNAQYRSMLQTSLSVQGRLMQVQATRQKREATEGAASQDAWTLHIAEWSMLQVTDPDAKPLEPPSPTPAAPANSDAKTSHDISETIENSQGMAFETLMSAQPSNRSSKRPQQTGLRSGTREAMAGLLSPQSPTPGQQSPATVPGSRASA